MVHSTMAVTVVETVLVIGHRSTRIGPKTVAARKLQHEDGVAVGVGGISSVMTRRFCQWPGRRQRTSWQRTNSSHGRNDHLWGTFPMAEVCDSSGVGRGW